MKIAVTGGLGFLGRDVIRRAMTEGHTAWSFDRHDGNDILGPLHNLRPQGLIPDVVIHLAGVLGTDELFDTPERAVEVNTIGSLRIIQWCEAHGAKYIGITMPQVFPSVYTATKIAATRLASAYHHSLGLEVAHVCAFNAYGPGQHHGPGHPQKIIPTFATEAWNNRPIPVWGDGEQTVDLVSSTDVARMLVDAAVVGGKDEIFDAGTGAGVTVNEVAMRILDMTGSTAGIEHLPMRRGETDDHALSAATGRGWELLEWRPRLDWADVEETVKAYRR